jgi:hypothetical protein
MGAAVVGIEHRVSALAKAVLTNVAFQRANRWPGSRPDIVLVMHPAWSAQQAASVAERLSHTSIPWVMFWP